MPHLDAAHDADLAAVGGPDNISAAAHCATRLRLVLADPAKVAQAALETGWGQKQLRNPDGSPSHNTFNIKADGEFKLSDEMRKVVVSNAGGRTVRLSDVAQIRDTLEKATMDERVNGQRGVRVMFQKQSGANTVNIVHEIQSRLPEIQKTLPKDVKMELIFEGSQEITDPVLGKVFRRSAKTEQATS